MNWKYRDILLLSLGVSAALVPLLRLAALRFGILDHPKAHGIHSHPVPRLGGVAIYAGFVAGALWRMDLSEMLKGVLIASSLIFAVGLADDLFRLRASVKLAVQLVACGIMMFRYGVMLRVFGVPAADAFFTVLGVIGLTNAVNFLDNMDGLAAGLVFISSFCLIVVATSTHQVWLGYLAAALAGASLGFLVFNLRPAHIFMGDCGSTFLGFTLASLCVMSGWSRNTWVTMASPILILGVPILDMILITVLRYREEKVRSLREWIDYTGKDHLSHRVARLGLGTRGAVLALWILQALFGAAGLTILPQGTGAGAAGLAIFFGVTAACVTFFRKKRQLLVLVSKRMP